jgi:hypothetical protein
MSKSYLNSLNLPRGIRNNNPGNLIKTNIAWQGKINPSKDPNFEQFITLSHGIRAMYKDVINDINKGKNTITKLINEYAPPHENNTTQYIDQVAKGVNLDKNAIIKKLDTHFLLMLGRSIVKMENGAKHTLITDDDLRLGLSMMGDVSTEKLSVVIAPLTTKNKELLKNITLYLLAPLGLFFLFFISNRKYNKQLKTKFKTT